MADEMYPNMMEDESAAPAEETGETSETVLIPKTLFAGKKPGDTITLTIDKEYEDEFLASPSGAEDETATETPPSADAELDMMANLEK